MKISDEETMLLTNQETAEDAADRRKAEKIKNLYTAD